MPVRPRGDVQDHVPPPPRERAVELHQGQGGCGLCGQVARPFRVRRAVLPAPREHRQRDARARRLHGGGALPERVPAALRNQARVLERRRGHVARLRHGRRAQAQARVDAEPEKRLQARRAQRLGGARRHAARHLRAVRRAVRARAERARVGVDQRRERPAVRRRDVDDRREGDMGRARRARRDGRMVWAERRRPALAHIRRL